MLIVVWEVGVTDLSSKSLKTVLLKLNAYHQIDYELDLFLELTNHSII